MKPFLKTLISLCFVSLAISDTETSGEESQHPYLVSLRRKNIDVEDSPTEHICGGAILNKRWIVSSAFCAIQGSKANRNELVIGIGGHSFPYEHLLLPTEEIIIHPNFTKTHMYDISLVKTASDIVFKSDAQPISLSKELIADKTIVFINGWSSLDVSRQFSIFNSFMFS